MSSESELPRANPPASRRPSALAQRGRPGPAAGGGLLQRLPAWVWGVTGVLALLGAFSPNPALTPFALVLLPLMASLVWFRGEPPVLVFACAMQWLQASAGIFYADLYGKSLAAGIDSDNLQRATWLSLLGVLTLALGMRLALLRPREVATEAKRESQSLQPVNVFIWYLVLLGLLYGIKQVAWVVPGLTQPLLALSSLRWVMVFLMAQAALTRRQGYGLLGAVILIEFVSGILGFFSSFKGVFFVLLVVLPTAGYLFRGWRLVQFLGLGLVVVVLAVVWTAVKVEYREFLSQGTGQQVVLVPVAERMEKLQQLVGGLTRESFDAGLEGALLRVSYVSYFAQVLGYVPRHLPHERGQLWLEALQHVFMPRMFFPNKAAINDSDRVRKYTGQYVAGAEEGTSISLGYMAESYIDFGPVGMFAPIFVLGMLYGLVYRYFVHHYPLRLLGFAMATSILVFGAYTIESSNLKLVGGNVTGFIVLALFAKFLGPTFWRLVAREPRARRVGAARRGSRRVASPAARRRPTPETSRPVR